MKLDRYFARRFMQSFLMIGAIFMALIIMVDIIEQVRRFEGEDVSFGQMLLITLLSAPAAISEILPLIMILSTIVLFVGLARSSELVVTRATGRSGIRALAAPITMAMVIGGLTVTTLNPIVAATSRRAQELIDEYRNGGTAVLSLSGEGLWLRQGGFHGQSVIHANGYSGAAAQIELLDVTIIAFGSQNTPVRQIRAETAKLNGTDWVLKNAKAWPLATGLNPETHSATHDELHLPTTLTEERIRDSIGRPSGVSIYNMQETIRELNEAGFSTRRYEVWFQVELARPLFLIAMVLVGAAFTMRHTRFGGTGVAVLAAVLLGFSLYFVRNFAQVLGENGQLPVALAAWAPPIASILLTIGLLLHAEDG
ncbi:MAG: LPS export ABC transporter permease LptG [Paracoccaceae bacterium]